MGWMQLRRRLVAPLRWGVPFTSPLALLESLTKAPRRRWLPWRSLGYAVDLIAKYNTELVVSIRTADLFPIAQEVARQRFLAAGKPDMFQETTVRFFSSDQFAYAASCMGFMRREKVAANLMVGAFWAEALLMAEAGAEVGAIQVAGTANLHQIPFFVAACDYTLIGEELFAGGAYLSPRQGETRFHCRTGLPESS
jgi:hypothetical protein